MEKTKEALTMDLEWLLLIVKAKELGIKKEEVRFFLEEEQQKLKQTIEDSPVL